MLTRLLATAFKSNSHTWNSICFSYVDMDMKTCKFKESGQFYYSVTRENTGLMLFINTNCWLSCWDPWKTERRAITCLSSTGVPPNWCRNVGSACLFSSASDYGSGHALKLTVTTFRSHWQDDITYIIPHRRKKWLQYPPPKTKGQRKKSFQGRKRAQIP